MAYNLPAAWDPGFVLPSNVRDEGLQRRAFVTKQLPRGTYDDPRVGTGGFAVPQYVHDEGYGQGTFTTKWQPSGSYVGPKVPNWLNQRPKVIRQRKLPSGKVVSTIQPLGDDEMPEPFETYGQRAAQMMLNRVAILPPGKRGPALHQIMDTIDKSLWTRVQGILRRYVAQGMTTAQALPLAIARAMSTGIAAEIIDAGLKRKPPQAKSLLGLGCYGPQAMGAIKRGDGSGDDPVREIPYVPPKPVPVKTDAEIAAWNALQAKLMQDAIDAGAKYDSHGILRSPVDNSWLDTVTDAYAGAVRGVVNVVTDAGAAVGSGVATVGTGVVKVGGAIASGVSYSAGAVADAVKSGAKVVYDIAGAPVRWTIDAAGAVYDAGGTVVGWVKDASGAIYDAAGKVIGWIKDAAVAVGHAVVDVVKGIGDLACDLLSAPGVGVAAGAASVAAGAPPQAGQAGVAIAKSACGSPPPPPAPIVQAPSVLPLAILGGAAVLAVLLLTPPKKTKPTP